MTIASSKLLIRFFDFENVLYVCLLLSQVSIPARMSTLQYPETLKVCRAIQRLSYMINQGYLKLYAFIFIGT